MDLFRAAASDRMMLYTNYVLLLAQLYSQSIHPSIHPTIHPPNIIQAKGNSSNLFAINRETQEGEAASVGGGWIVGSAASV